MSFDKQIAEPIQVVSILRTMAFPHAPAVGVLPNP